MEDVFAHDTSTVTIRGGVIAAVPQGPFDIHAEEASSINISGSGFAVDGVPVPFGPIAATTGTLTGILASGEAIDVRFLHATPISEPDDEWRGAGLITLIQAPQGCGLGFELALILPGLMWLHRRRRRLH